MSIVIAIIIFSVIIIIHEAGHCIFAKKSRIRVEEFSVGLGPTIIGKTIGETKYSIKLLPFGGACLMTGEDGESDDPRAFGNASLLGRILTVFAGPFFNFILAFVLAMILIGAAGYDDPVVSVTEGGAAEEAGLLDGDEIIKINNNTILVYREIASYSVLHPNKMDEELTVTYKRDGEVYTTTLTPIYSEEDGKYMIGVGSLNGRTRGGILSTIKYSCYEVEYWIETTLNSLKLLILRKVSPEDMSGPVGIVSTISSTYKQSATISAFAVVINLLNISILLTANLGVMNLLPLPALDGGRLVFLFIELITRKKVPPEKEGFVHMIGFLLLMALMVVILFNDIRNILM
ncbi:MAG: RIP metalloprotease RseP [Eubacterium sp.]|nr:RIP metalloprotease RseP [Eubacterium sp.]